jgi:protein-S-isoprenylcysteine O-methyltransferase Ste14
MGYGLILAPAMVILGFETAIIVPALLLSQALAGMPATVFHRVQDNLVFEPGGNELRGMVVLVLVGFVTIFVAVWFSVSFTSLQKELYLAILLVAMGVVLLAIRNPRGNGRWLTGFGIFSVFNKAFTGAGFGPVYTTGQILCGRSARRSIAYTTLLEVPLCMFAFGMYWYIEGSVDMGVPILLTVGAAAATPFGPHQTSKLTQRTGQLMVGVLSLFLGVFLLIWNWIRPCIDDVIMSPFFWALFSMMMLMGCTATLVTHRLGRFRTFNIFCVGMFAVGRFIIPISCPHQPQFDMGLSQWVIGGIIFLAGMAFLSAARYINPWPVIDQQYRLVTTGLFGVVRHPMYLGELHWTLGWSIMWGSVLGVAMVPVWWAALLFHSVLEEEHLDQRFGKEYTEYTERVRGRIFPGLPV